MVTRVVYDREVFNYEEYTSKCLCDNRLLNRTVLATTTSLPNRIAPGKYLVGELFKFHQLEIAYDPVMQSVTALSGFIQHLSTHASAIDSAGKVIDIEPILLVYFSSLTRTNISKDALSKVSKTFFKELKMHYRKLGTNFTTILVTFSNFFLSHES